MALDKQSQNTNGQGFASLKEEQFILLKTSRKNGTMVPTPVWFAYVHGNLYVTTTTTAGKVKRIRNYPRVLLTPCDRRGVVHGEEVAGVARQLAPDEYPIADAALKSKYGFLYQVIRFLGSTRKTSRTYIEIRPE